MKKSPLQKLRLFITAATLLLSLSIFQQSCTKTNEAAQAVTTTPVDNF
ncbi:MAG: hypothetical protein IPJ81_17360 [Chitinophagaceae bacterium]|nr:hypothetical protein [Chitinophagaceae bacterium]